MHVFSGVVGSKGRDCLVFCLRGGGWGGGGGGGKYGADSYVMG